MSMGDVPVAEVFSSNDARRPSIDVKRFWPMPPLTLSTRLHITAPSQGLDGMRLSRSVTGKMGCAFATTTGTGGVGSSATGTAEACTWRR